MNEREALQAAVEAGNKSPCVKSKRGVIIFRSRPHPFYGFGPYPDPLASGFNTPPPGFTCDGSEACRRDCGKVCVHAEAHAILAAGRGGVDIHEAEMLHVKVVDGVAVPSGPPSCWQCSRDILFSGLSGMWLYEQDSAGGPVPILRRYGAVEFHEATLRNCGLHLRHQESGCPSPSSDLAGRKDTERTP